MTDYRTLKIIYCCAHRTWMCQEQKDHDITSMEILALHFPLDMYNLRNIENKQKENHNTTSIGIYNLSSELNIVSHPILRRNQMHLIRASGSISHTYDRRYKCISEIISYHKEREY
jgi:hypothetical protein